MYLVWVYFHIVGSLLFVAAHGVSAAVAVAIRRERCPTRLAALLALSTWARPISYSGLAMLLVSGVAAGWLGDWWSHGWIWASLLLLLALALGALPLVPYFHRLRRVLRSDGSPSQIEQALDSSLPLVVAAYESVGVAAILWLMVFKPF
ncbi:MAG: DUF2269 family protein [Dehalococcoidia bacterium]